MKARPEAAEPEDPGVAKTEGVCGGSACVGETRMAVWMLVQARQFGVTEAQLLADHPSLTPAHLEAAWTYYEAHRPEIDQEIAEQNESG